MICSWVTLSSAKIHRRGNTQLVLHDRYFLFEKQLSVRAMSVIKCLVFGHSQTPVVLTPVFSYGTNKLLTK